MKRAVAATAAAATLLAAACAQLELKPPATVEFELLGRIAARYAKDAFTGNLQWRHAASGDEMLITTPMGQGVARIVREGEAVQLTTADGRQYRAPDAESLTERTLGFRLPLEGLADWVQGRPSPGLPAREVKASDGKLQSLDQRGWHVDYLAYGDERPSLMRLNYEGVELRLAITAWK
ncbi:MAG TPA: lipoprotein insertase outer membrane protein LolB [Burkholderiales bacterium]|nr:lipoprotein insertase outer membrane protein LolB [Burkholderiales bacterium]